MAAMVGTLPRTTPAPLAQAPLFARDAHELHAVLDAQNAEAAALKERLAVRQRECAQLRTRARTAHGEVAVAHEATLNATERLGVHAERHSLVLAAGMERIGVERTHVEHDLQQIEALLHERDLEIGRLRREAHQLEARAHQNEMEIKGLTVATEAANTHARSLNTGVSELLQQLHASADPTGTSSSLAGPRSKEDQRNREAEMVLMRKQQENMDLRARAVAVAQEAQRLEKEQEAVRERVAAFEMELRTKQEHMGHNDQRFMREGELLRQHCDELRRVLHAEQRDSAGVDQRAGLHMHSSADHDGVRREVSSLLSSVPRLSSTLTGRGRVVVSPPVAGDPIDEQLHEVLQHTGARPSIVWRLSQGEYVIGTGRVTVLSGPHGLLVHEPQVGSVLLGEYLSHHAAAGHKVINH